jgi:hypothetical protein
MVATEDGQEESENGGQFKIVSTLGCRAQWGTGNRLERTFNVTLRSFA